jgi:CubicO group peptidase (beta-lactamase class C family)
MAFQQTAYSTANFVVRDPFLRLTQQFEDLKGEVLQQNTVVDPTVAGPSVNALLVTARTPVTNNTIYKGMFCAYGNFYSNTKGFETVGTARSDGSAYTEDTLVSWASCGKFFTPMILAKMLEEGLITTQTTVASLVPDVFAANTGSFLTSVTIGAAAGAPSSTWTGATGTFNWLSSNSYAGAGNVQPGSIPNDLTATFTIDSLLQFNFPFIYDFNLAGSPGALILADNPGIIGQGIYGGSPGSLVGGFGGIWGFHTRRFVTNFYAGNLTQDPVYRAFQGQTPVTVTASLTQLVQQNVLNNIPALWIPGAVRTVNTLPYNTLGYLPSVYGPSYELLGLCLERAVVAQTTFTTLAAYARARILTPLALTSTRIALQEDLSVVTNYATRLAESTFVRGNGTGIYAVTTATPNIFSSTVTTVVPSVTYNYGIASGAYTVANTVAWDSEAPADGIARLSTLLNTSVAAGAGNFFGGAPIVASIKDFIRLLSVLSFDGKTFDGVRVLSKQVCQYINQHKVSGLTNTWNFFPLSAEDGNSSSEASGNVAAQNYDLITSNNLWRNPLSQSAAGLESTRFWFNKQNGYYLVYGTQQNSVGTTLGTVFSNDLLEGLVIASQRGAY